MMKHRCRLRSGGSECKWSAQLGLRPIEVKNLGAVGVVDLVLAESARITLTHSVNTPRHERGFRATRGLVRLCPVRDAFRDISIALRRRTLTEKAAYLDRER